MVDVGQHEHVAVRRGRHRRDMPPPRRPWLLPAALVVLVVATGGAVAAGATAGTGAGSSAASAPAPLAAALRASARSATGARPGATAAPTVSTAPTRAPEQPSVQPAVVPGAELLTWGGVTRRALTFSPPVQTTALPLLLVLHGRASNPHGEERRTAFDALAASGDAVVAYPEAVGPSWNAGACCDGAQADDSGFLVALTQRLVAQGVVDPARVYAVGFSTGGMMAYRLACDAPGLLAGVGSVGGVLLTPCPAALRVPLVDIHSRLDPLVPLRGTRSSRTLGGIALPGVGDVVDGWRRRTGCTGRLYAAAVVPVGSPEHPVELRDVRGCAAGAAVRLYLTTAHAHVWPQAADGLDASAVVWDFLRRQRRS